MFLMAILSLTMFFIFLIFKNILISTTHVIF